MNFRLHNKRDKAGSSGGCPMSQMTLKQGIEQHIKKAVESVAGIFGVSVDPIVA
ncbi:MAG: NifU family protein [Deltaproteobacteria bacterium]|nr:NifU family protein [Deltaproteobacteria bacterium]